MPSSILSRFLQFSELVLKKLACWPVNFMIGYDNSLFKRQYTLRFYYALLQHQCTLLHIYCLCHPDTENNNKSYVGTVHNEFPATHEFFHEHLSNQTFIQYITLILSLETKFEQNLQMIMKFQKKPLPCQ